MPFEIMDSPGLSSSSYFSESLPNEVSSFQLRLFMLQFSVSSVIRVLGLIHY